MRDEPFQWPKRCSCGREYTAGEWGQLDVVGVQEGLDDEDLELRACDCGSTLSVPVRRRSTT